MKVITRYELEAMTNADLYGLLRESLNTLAKSNPNCHQRTNALASIENIQRELAERALHPLEHFSDNL
ncbi:MAG: hypothetical protein ACRBCK_05575 [Alphaproteobacteria bacterium]